MNVNEIAFFIGLFGSIHCIGMCGPLAFAIPVQNHNYALIIWDKAVYNFGRVISYSLIGLLAGLIGRRLWLAGLQQGISIFSGVLIILAASSRFIKYPLTRGKFFSRLLSPFYRLMSFAVKNKAGHLVVGLLNGFLPCGFVYLALVGSVNTGSVAAGVQYMFWFGIGTMPLMLAATVGTGFFNTQLRRQMNRIVPYFMLCLGVWFVLRGLALNVPYLSPAGIGNPGVCR